MRRVKCYGRAKTKVIDTSAKNAIFADQDSEAQAIFDASGDLLKDKNPPVPQKEKYASSDDTYSTHSDKDSPEVLLYRDEISGRKLRADSKKQPLKKGKLAIKLRRQKYGRKCKKVNQCLNETIDLSLLNQPRWSSINEYSLTVDKSVRKKKKATPAAFFYSDEKENPDKLQDSIDVAADQSLVSAPCESFKGGHSENRALFSYITPEQEHIAYLPSNKSKELCSATPVLTHRNVGRIMHLQKTSTPAISHDKAQNLNNFPLNLSRISSIGNKGTWHSDLSMNSHNRVLSLKNASQLLNTMKAQSAALCASEKSLYNKAGDLSKSKTHSSVLQNSAIVNNSQHQSSRSCIRHAEIEESALKDVCVSRSCNSIAKIISLSSSLVCSTSSKTECTLLKLLEFSQQDSIIAFDDIYDWSHTNIRKIGEGTYGEVFTLTQKKISSVIKVIPFSEESDNHSMQNVETIFSEVKVSQCLSQLRSNKVNQTKNFNKLKSVSIVKGCYPSQMLIAWDVFSNSKTSYNCRPDTFSDQQMFAILELEYGGKDMTCFVMRSAVEAESVFKQIAISLAIAEEAHLFEHRDLHLGNILVQRNTSKKILYVLRGKPFSIRSEGLVVTIIDFTLSRVLDSGCVFFNNLANDESLFNQSGDFQFEVYKMTRLQLNNEWQKSLLYSNVLWLTFFCVKALEYQYSRPTSKKHLGSMQNIKVFQKHIAECKSALECVKICQILLSIPERNQLQDSELSRTTKFFDRKSFQKSNLCIRA